MKFVKLVTLGDPVEAGMLKELLENEGISVSAPGLMHRGMLGMVGSYVDIVLEVPDDRLEDARAILADTRGEPEADGEHESVGVTDERIADSPRKKLVAAFCACCMTFGCGHFYTRSYRTGVLLLVLQLATLFLMLQGASSAAIGLPLLVVADLLGALVAVDRFNGVPRDDLWAKLTPLWVAGALLAVAFVPAIYAVAPDRLVTDAAAEICAFRGRCLGESESTCRQDEARRRLETVVWASDATTVACAACLSSHADTCVVARCDDDCLGAWSP